MSIRFFNVFVFVLFFSLGAQGQLAKKLERADSLTQANEFKAAIKLVSQVLEAKPRTFLRSQAYYQLSYIHLQLNNLDQALYYNQESLNLRDQISYEFIADNYMRFGTIALLQGRYETALDYYLEAKDLPHADLQFSGILDGYLAIAYDRLGDDDQALENYKNSLDILEWAIGETTVDVAVAEYNLANFYQSIDDLENAKVHYERAKMIETALIPEGPNPRHAKILNALGWLVYKDKFELDQVMTYFNQALEKSEGHRRMTALSQINLAQIYYNSNNLNQARKYLNTALDLLNPFEDDFSYSIPLVLDKQLYSRGLALSAELHLAEYNSIQQVSALEKALVASSQAMQVFEGRMMESYDENSQLQFIRYSADNYEQAIQIALQLFEKTNDPSYREKAFQYAEQAKAIVLKSQMQQFQVMLSDRLPEDLRKKEEQIRDQLTFFESEKAVKYEAGNFRKAALDLKRAYHDLLKKIEQSAPEYFDLRYDQPAVTLMDVQSKLDRDDLVLSYFMGANMYYIFAVGKQDFNVYYTDQNIPLDNNASRTGLKDFNKKAKKGFPVPTKAGKKGDIPKLPKPDVGIYTQYSDESMDLKSGVDQGLAGMIKLSKGQFITANHSLYRRLIEPVKSMLKGKKNLIVIPHDDLHLVLFETLLQEKPKQKAKYKKLKYLIKDYSISYEVSAGLINSPMKLVDYSFAGWAPVFDPQDEMGYTLDASEMLTDTTYYHEFELRSLVPNRSTFMKLEHSEHELNAVLELFAKSGKTAKAYFKMDATEKGFKKEAGSYQILHLASHSFINPKVPKWSGIALVPDEMENEDGILLAGEVMNLDLANTDLVVLSSCESGTGELVRGEGQLSLNRAFQYAGVNNIISTRWKITDKHSALLMKFFYQKLLDGADYAEALRYAKLKFIKKSKTATPKLWAGFTLMGF